MRVGIYAQVRNSDGGVFRYTMTLLEMLRAVKSDDEFLLLHRRKTDLPVDALVGGNCVSARMHDTVTDKVRELGLRLAGASLARRAWYYAALTRPSSVVRSPMRNPRLDLARAQWYSKLGLDLVLYPVHSVLAFETQVPSIVTVHDLNHRVYTEFPEVRALGEFERREYYFRNACRSAFLLLVSSDTGRDEVLSFYADTGISTDRIVVFPMLPATTIRSPASEDECARVRQRYCLTGDYLFYPAQFWPHKNHLRLIHALYHLKHAVGLTPTLVLGGSHSGWLRRRTFVMAMQAARRLGVYQQIRYLGFIPDEDMSPLYGGAAGLVMPTFFGPTNIPVLEAFAMGCPVVTSDLSGIREQANGAAILVDPRSPEAIADGMRRVLVASEDRHALIRRGREVLCEYTPEDYRRILQLILEKAKASLGKNRRSTL